MLSGTHVRLQMNQNTVCAFYHQSVAKGSYLIFPQIRSFSLSLSYLHQWNVLIVDVYRSKHTGIVIFPFESTALIPLPWMYINWEGVFYTDTFVTALFVQRMFHLDQFLNWEIHQQRKVICFLEHRWKLDVYPKEVNDYLANNIKIKILLRYDSMNLEKSILLQLQYSSKPLQCEVIWISLHSALFDQWSIEIPFHHFLLLKVVIDRFLSFSIMFVVLKFCLLSRNRKGCFNLHEQRLRKIVSDKFKSELKLHTVRFDRTAGCKQYTACLIRMSNSFLSSWDKSWLWLSWSLLVRLKKRTFRKSSSKGFR